MEDKSSPDLRGKPGVVLCTFRFFDDELPEFTRILVKAKSDVEALRLGEEELGEIIYELQSEIISYEST